MHHTTDPRLISIASEIEEHVYVTSVAILHLALANSTMEETVQAADALRLAYRMDEAEKDQPESSPGGQAVSFEDTIKLLYAIERDLDDYHDVTLATAIQLHDLIEKLDGQSAPDDDCPF